MAAQYHRPDAGTVQALYDIANKLRIHSVRGTNASNSGHPTSCASAAEIMSVLFFNVMRYTVKEPRHPANDRFILSKGHAAPVLYAAWAEAGLLTPEDLLNLRKLGNDLEGHPTPRLNFIDVATGSLGQGLSVGAGMAYVGKYLDKSDYRVYCVLGDGESSEGSVWEALAFGSHYKLDNMVAIFDVNRLGQSEAAPLLHEVDTHKRRLEAFGYNTYVVDGHDVEALCKALHDASTVKGKPSAIVAKTFKGKGFPDIEDKENWHGKALGAKGDAVIAAINKNIKDPAAHINPHAPTATVPDVDISNIKLCEPPNYQLNQQVAVRVAYGTALVKIGKNNPRVIALDGDTKNSTMALTYKNAFPDRFIECFIAEQNMIGVGIGAACRNRTVAFASAFACFLERGYDQIRMGAISQTNLNLCGSHCGVSIGEDGPSQMALEDLAVFRAVQGSTVFYPSDAVSCERAVELAANTKGITFIRSGRPVVPVLYKNDEDFAVGKAKIIRQSSGDQVTVVGAGVTLNEALKAADLLHEQGINIRVIDPFTIKPIDGATIAASARQTGGRVITVEDHYPEGGLGDAVAGALSEERDVIVKRLAVMELPRSGKPAELLAKYGIDAAAICDAVKQVIKL